jgi:hypothetical protein
MLEIRQIYDANGTGSHLNRWQRRHRYFVVLHVRAARDLLGHRGHYPCNSAADSTALLTPNGWIPPIGSVNPTSPGALRLPNRGSSVAARTPSSSLMAIRGQRATTGVINQTRPSRRLKATFRDGHHILWCRAVLILTRNLLEGQMRKQSAFGFAAVAIGLVTIAWAEASIVTPHQDLVRPKAELAPSALTPNLPFQVLRPIY